MDAPVNLNKFRKAKAREEKRAQADENAVKFGMTKAEKLLIATRNAKAQVMLDQHHLDEEE